MPPLHWTPFTVRPPRAKFFARTGENCPTLQISGTLASHYDHRKTILGSHYDLSVLKKTTARFPQDKNSRSDPYYPTPLRFYYVCTTTILSLLRSYYDHPDFNPFIVRHIRPWYVFSVLSTFYSDYFGHFHRDYKSRSRL